MLLRLRHRVVQIATQLLTRPLKRYYRPAQNNVESLRRYIKKGDVLLVEGDQRVSEVIKYLTQSSWSHAAIYVGDELWRRNPHARAELLERFGEDAQHLIVEALVEEGVVASPVSKYIDFNIRICRPWNLRREDVQAVMSEIISQIGYRYDIKNLIDLARYFLPVSLVPRRFRRKALAFGSGIPTQVICSSMIARAFGSVRYPIVPEVTATGELAPRSFRDWWDGRTTRKTISIFRRQSATLISPRDFDISPYFDIIKFNLLEDVRFDYRKIRWVEDQAS
jgi:hypothetical protein